MISDDDAQALHDAYQTLYDALDDAYWAARADVRPTLMDAKNGISAVLDKLNAEDLNSRSGALADLAATFVDTNVRLKRVRDDVSALLRGVAAATQVAAGVDKVIELSGQVVK